MKRQTIALLHPGLLDAIKDLEAMGIWECLRRAGRPLDAATLSSRTSRSIAGVHAALDVLARAELVTTKKARGRRRSVAYEVALQELSIVIDAGDAAHRRLVNEVASFINSEMSDLLFKVRRPIGSTGPNTWHFHHCGPMALDDADLRELKRRIARVEEFVRLLGDKHGSDRGGASMRCNHGMAIRIEPLAGHVLPQPHVEFVSPTTVAERRSIRGVAHEALTARERQIARALRDGQPRAEVARRLGISALTVGTLCKRLYRKLGIRRAAQLHDFTLEQGASGASKQRVPLLGYRTTDFLPRAVTRLAAGAEPRHSPCTASPRADPREPSMNAAIRSIQITAIGALLAAGTAHADWSNLGGNAQSNGLSAVVGPWAADETWSRSDMSCLISWVPITSGNRVFMVRQTYAQAPYNPPPGEARVHCLDLQSGATLWTFDCPFEPGDWTTVVYGARDGRVFVGRGGNGSSASARVHCLDAATGSLLWVSADEVSTGSYDGVVFMDNGDPIFASNTTMRRLDAQSGATVWNVTRTCSVSGNCGPARDGDSIYLDEVAPGGQKISRFNATTGQRLYSSQTMPGFLNQTSPFCAPGGLVFYLRASNEGPTNDKFYAFRDTGTAFELLWTASAYTEPFARHAITPDGGVTMLSRDGRLQIRDQVTGALRAQSDSPVLSPSGFTSSMVAVDSLGRIFHNNSNGAGGSTAEIRSFDPSLDLRWSVAMTGVSQGGPSLANDGSLLLAGTGEVRRYWAAPPCIPQDLDCNGSVGPTDIAILLSAWGACGKGTCVADIDRDGVVGPADIAALLSAWG